jgi:hypothetical protein
VTAGQAGHVGGAAPAGHVMVNEGAGEKATFPSAEGSPVSEMALKLGRSHRGPTPHVHLGAEVTVVVRGALEVLLGRRWRRLDEGEEATAGRGTRHTYRGVPGAPVQTMVRFTSGAPMRAFLTDLHGLAVHGRVDPEGSPRLRDAATLFRAHPAAMSLAGIPTWVQSPLWRGLARGPA